MGKRIFSEEHKRKLSEAKKGKISNMKGKSLSTETKKKISDANKGKSLSAETKKKMSEAKKGKSSGMKGKHQSEKTKQKLSESNIGKIVSEETRQKLSEAKKNISDETRQKLRISAIKYIELTGPIYPNIGRNETKILDNLSTEFGFVILRQFRVGGFFLDGYIPELNLAIEVDEKKHKKQIEKDIEREEFIKKELNCEFLRIKDY